MVVRDYLTEKFKLDDTRIKTLGLGKAGETSDSGKLEIIVYQVGSIPPVQKLSSDNRTPRQRPTR